MNIENLFNENKRPILRIGAVICRFLCKIGLHNWKFSHDTGINEYYECKWCGKREVRYCYLDGYQPIDRDWINKQPDSFNHTPPSF